MSVRRLEHISPPEAAMAATRAAIRSMFSNEPVDKLALLGTRVRAALAAASDRT